MMPKNKKKRKMTVAEARQYLAAEEAQKLIDMDEVTREAMTKAENDGIIFLMRLTKLPEKRVLMGLMFPGAGYKETSCQLLKVQP